MKIQPPVFDLRSAVGVLLIVSLTLSLFAFPQGVSAQGLSFPAEINKEFSPISISSGGISRLSITIFNPNLFQLANAAWVDNLIGVQAGIKIANPVNLTNTCGGTVVAPVGGTSLSLSGGIVPAQVGITPGACTVSIDVTSTTPGNLINTIPAGGLTGTGGGGTITNTTPASATLQVGAVLPPTINKSFNPNTILVGQTSQLTITVRNTDANIALTQTTFTDNLPANVVLANPVGTTLTNCGASASVTGVSGGNSLTLVNSTIPAGGTCTIVVNVTSNVEGTYTNTIPAGAITTTQGVTNGSPASAPLNVQGVSISKAFLPVNFEAGSTTTLTITIQNPLNIALTGIALSDTLPAPLVVSGAATTTCAGGVVSTAPPRTVNLTNGSLPAATAGTPGICTISVQVTTPVGTNPITYTNTIPAGALITNQNVTNTNPATADVRVYAAGLGVRAIKSFLPATINPGENSRLRIFIIAPADRDLTNFSIVDTFPAGLTVSNSTPASKGAACGVASVLTAVTGATSISLTGGNIVAGTTCRIDVYVTATVAGVYTNTINPGDITNNENDTIPSPVSASLTVNSLTDISQSKLFTPAIIAPNGISLLTISLTNTNASPLVNVSLLDSLPGNTTNGLVIAPVPNAATTCGSGVVTAVVGTQTISLSGGTIPAQVAGVPGLCTITINVQGKGALATYNNTIPAANVSGTIQGTATVIHPIVDATAPLTITNLSIGVVKEFNPLTVFGGSASIMGVQLINPNNADLVGIAFTDNMPVGMIIANPVNSSVGTCGGTINATPGNNSFSFSGGNLPPFGSCILSLNITMTVNGNLTNTIDAGAVTTTNGASNPQPAKASLTNLPGASVSKAFSRSPINAGDYSLLTITIQNTGNIPLTGMGLNDGLPGTLPSGLSIAGAPAPAPVNNCGGTLTAVAGSQTILLTNGILGASSFCTLVIPVTSNVPGSYQNIIPAGNLTTNEGATNNSPATDTLIVQAGSTTASIGDFVWLDANANGVQDAGEVGIGGVTVNLYSSTGTLIGTTTTAADGSYHFTGLTPGDYYVQFVPPVGYTVSPQDQGGNDATDSDANPANGRTIVTTLTAGENDVTWDMGLYQPAALGDTVWSDLNQNGIQDGGAEVGIDGVTVNLYRPGYGPDGVPGNADDNSIVATTTTAGGGKYLFNNLIPGNYYVDFIPPAGYVLSPQDQGGNDATDSDANPVNGQTIVTTLTSGETDLTWDAGLYQSASLGDFVWLDSNANGIQEAGETGIDGVTVQLYSSAGTLIGTTTTSGGGLYLFTNLVPGNYYVRFVPPAGYTVSPQDQGGNDAADSDANPANGQTVVTTITAGENDLTWDAGLYQPASLGDFVWNDVNANGIQDAGESGVNGVTVNLYRPGYGPDGIPGNADDNNIVATTTTAGNGNYLFNNLIPGNYSVEFISPAGYVFSPQNQGGNDSVDSDASPANGRTAVTTLTSGENDLTWDAGLYQPASLGDFVWNDLNVNGIQDAGENGIPNVTVQLYNGAGVLQATTTTDANGAYLFTGLVPGDYYVRFVAPNGYTITLQNQGGNTAADSDANPANGQTIVTTLTPGEVDRTWDAGMFQPPVIGLTKSVTGTNLPNTTGTNMAIGEIVTYQASVVIPPGTYATATLVDTMERGLAFVVCDSIDAPGLTTSVAGSFTAVCSNAVTSDAGGATTADVDRQVTYDFGTLTNPGQTNSTLTVTYRAIVLDIAVNRRGNVLNNGVVWNWIGGKNGPAQTTVKVVEPALTIKKTANTNTITVGKEVTFTLTISHTAASNSDAFDAIVTDVLPAGISYVANSLDCTVGAQDPDPGTCVFDNTNPAQPTIRAQWSVFTRNGGTGQIRFRATGNTSLPQSGITNVANVEWSSMPGAQQTPQSKTPNIFSVERHYDPNDAVDVYISRSSLKLPRPGSGNNGGGGGGNASGNLTGGFLIPLTGFAPDTVTVLNAATRPTYGFTAVTLEIPSIKVNAPIVGVAGKDGNWDVSWLVDQVGWLEGTAYPTWDGNSVLTAHVVNADGKPGLFNRLDKVRVGDYIFLYQSGYRYTYQILSNKNVQADDSSVMKHEDKPTLTLITCNSYDERSGTYLRRTVVRAVLIDVSVQK